MALAATVVAADPQPASAGVGPLSPKRVKAAAAEVAPGFSALVLLGTTVEDACNCVFSILPWRFNCELGFNRRAHHALVMGNPERINGR